METTYEFSAYNTESIYGFGSEAEATQYLRWLNRGRTVNLREMNESTLSDEQAETLAINLRDELQDLEAALEIAASL
jgi:hypothetical protein